MLFDERPKTRKEDFYDLEKAWTAITSAMRRGDPLILILGLRRTGKTSLLLTSLNTLNIPKIVIDLRTLGSQSYATKKDIYRLLENSVNTFLNEQKSRGQRLLEKLKVIKGIQAMGTGVSLNWGGKESLDIADFFEALNDWASKEGQRVVVALDEAQELKKVQGLSMSKILAHVYDYCKNISILLTGSAVGLLYEFIGSGNSASPLYGRTTTEIPLKRLENKLAIEFLKKGFKEAKLEYTVEVANMAVKSLDGIIGWLTMFGSLCAKGKEPPQAIEQVISIGKEISRQEFGNFLKGREVARSRYGAIMKHIAKGPASWSGIKGSVEAVEGKTINSRNLTELITNLVNAGFIEKIDGNYAIADPLLVHAFS